MDSKTFYQAVLLGIVTVLVGLLLSFVFGSLKPELNVECEQWNKYYVMEVSLFTTGFIIRYLLSSEMGRNYLYSA
jgi:hypothetical protein